jgi:eukaryotic-like serine/threonine-protein kinase
MARLNDQLPSLLAGRARPKDIRAELSLASLCRQPYKALYAASARWYTDAFTAQPKLADNLNARYRYNAACAAALAGCGKGKDAEKLSPADRAHWRQQALAWLQADLKAYRQIMDKSAAKAGPQIAQRLQHWLEDTDLAGIRDSDALLHLPQPERGAWQKLWQDVEDLRQRAEKPAARAAGHQKTQAPRKSSTGQKR